MRNYRINLLRQKDETIVNKIVYFALHYLRYIIVLTQIVVIGVFFYRFKIDQDIIDLKDSVNQKQEIFKITLPLVQEAQAVDQKSNLLKTVLTGQQTFTKQLSYIVGVIPQGIILQHLNITPLDIKLGGTAADVNLVKLMVNKIETDHIYRSVTIDTIDKDGAVFDFTITIIR